jgi:hypothetical protein
MNWERLITSPPPNTGWTLGVTDAIVVHRTAGGELHCAAEEHSDGGFEVGPVGLQAMDSEVVVPAFARLKGAAEGAQTAAVIVPTGWLRSFLIEIDRVSRKESELHDVVRWRLKKLLPVAPTDLRLSVVPLPETGGKKPLLVMAGVERAMAAIEETFSSIGIEVGLITTRLFAIVPRNAGADRPILVIQHEEAFLSLLLLSEGVPRVLRTKPLAADGDSRGTVLRETGLTLGFIRDNLGVEGPIEVKLSCEDPDMDAQLREWLAAQEGLAPAPDGVLPPCGPTTVASRVGPARIAPAAAVVMGELR